MCGTTITKFMLYLRWKNYGRLSRIVFMKENREEFMAIPDKESENFLTIVDGKF